MKNAFKSNSRFAVLAEDTALDTVFTKNSKDKKKCDKSENKSENKSEGNSFTSNDVNSFKNYNTHSQNQSIRYVNKDFESIKSKELRKKQEKEQEEERKKLREEEDKKSLSMENFPDLLENVDNNKNIMLDKTMTGLTDFIDKVKFVKPVIESTKIINHITPGWIEMKQDHKTTNIITTSNLLYSNENLDNNISNNVLNSLVILHEKRSEEYINMWGYDMWEKVFTFPNYDYEYFNKLDEKYKEEMEMFENESDSDSELYYNN
jgi:hypothetical protein